MIEGGCLCGDVAFRIGAAALALYRCHCSICRRASGGGALDADAPLGGKVHEGAPGLAALVRDLGVDPDEADGEAASGP